MKARRPIGDPGNESRDPRMRAERIDRRMTASEFRFGEGRMNDVVADLM
jgi:hypothetical protein